MFVSRYLRSTNLIQNNLRYCSQVGKDQLSLFFNEDVQELLKKLTRIDTEKVFRRRRDGSKMEPPEYKFMTTADLEKARNEAMERAKRKVAMPPVLPPREEINFVFVEDPRLEGYSDSKFVFTDITFGNNDVNRTIVVREESGTLRKANLDERSRMNELYFPRPGRKIKPPSMFTDDKKFESLMERKEYEFVLDRACVQFEPNDPLYIRIVEKTYDRVDDGSDFDMLRSTRHFGPLVFYLTRNRRVDNLLKENLETDRLEDAVWLILLYHILHKDAGSARTKFQPGKELDFIKVFIEKDAQQKDKLLLVFSQYKEYFENPKKFQAQETS